VLAPRPPIPHLQFAEIAVFSANPKGQFGKYRSLLVLLFEESLKYLTTGLMFDNKGVEFQVLACYPPYGAVEVGTELLLSDFILTRRPLPEVTLSGTGIAALGLERLIPRDNFPVHEGSVYPGQELALPGANVVLWSVAEGSGVVTALTHVKVQELENTRSCALAPAPGTGFVDLSGSQIFAAIRLLGELVARFRLGRRFVVRSGAQFKLGGLQLHICYADPSPSLLTSETNVQVLSSVREYLPPAPRPQMSSFRRPLPVLEDREFSSSAEIICTICQSQLDPGCSAVTLPCSTLHTGHMYHSACIRPWLQDNRNCPMCKLSIY